MFSEKFQFCIISRPGFDPYSVRGSHKRGLRVACDPKTEDWMEGPGIHTCSFASHSFDGIEGDIITPGWVAVHGSLLSDEFLLWGSLLNSYSPFWGQKGFENDREP